MWTRPKQMQNVAVLNAVNLTSTAANLLIKSLRLHSIYHEYICNKLYENLITCRLTWM